MSACDFRPFPGNGAYGHWTCGRRRWHLGWHRSINYTYPRIPHVWAVRRLWRAGKVNRRIERLGEIAGRRKDGPGYRRALYPTRYEPVS